MQATDAPAPGGAAAPGAQALSGLRVLELCGGAGSSTGQAAAYATRLLADLGADVCKVEPRSGDGIRPQGGRFAYLNGAKRSAAVDLVSPEGSSWLVDAVTAADVVVEALGAGGLERLGLGPNVLGDANPLLSLVRISDFGQSGPLAGVPTTGLTLQAFGGWVSAHGLVGRSPVQVGGAIAEYTVGTFAAAAALTAVRAASRSGIAAAADLSAQECLVGTLAYPNLVMDDMLGAGLPPPTARHFPLPGIVRCRDGWVGINALTGQHFLDACVMLEVEDLGPRQQELANGGPLLDEFFARIQPWLDARDAQDIVELSQAFRVPAAPVGDGEMMLDYAQFRARPFFVAPEDGELAGTVPPGTVLPGPPYRLGKTPARRRGPAPALGDLGPPATGASAVGVPAVGTPGAAADEPALPFAGLRVLDLGTFWAGPYCTMYLGAFGADVLKVESTRRPDGFRFSGALPEMGEDWYERGGIFAATNLDKREVTLELSTEAGRALFLRLVEDADIVLENFSARVVEQFDLGYDALRAVKPDLIMVRMPGFGLEGPWRDYVGWAMVIEQATGMAAMTGPPERPMHPGGLADPVIGMHAAVAVQAALAHRDRTGEGQMIEVAQLETGANLTAELVLGASPARLGNRDATIAPQGVYACRADTPMPEWIAVSVVDDDQWRVLATALGRDDWLADASLATAAGRQVAHDALDAGISAWTAERSPDEVIAALRPAGIAVAPVLAVPRMYSDPQLVARGYYQELPHARTGARRYPGWPVQFSLAGAPVLAHHRCGSPTLGQHNEEILGGLLGLSGDEIAALAAEGVIGTRMRTV